MNRNAVLQKSPRLSETRHHHVLPVLIEVPTISVVSRTSWRRSAGVGSRPRRRRLRREVRMVGYTILTAMVLMILVPWRIRPAETRLANLLPMRTESSWTDQPAFRAPPLVSISIEPVALAPVAEARFPVVFPGYLLPDDGPDEEPAHAGY